MSPDLVLNCVVDFYDSSSVSSIKFVISEKDLFFLFLWIDECSAPKENVSFLLLLSNNLQKDQSKCCK